MGILNVTPDSFYAPSRLDGSVDAALNTAGKMVEEGASILDVGGMSTRPGAPEIPVGEEISRVVPVVESLRKNFPDTVISVDTYRAKVASESLKAGAGMINDISGGQLDDSLLDVLAGSGAAYVLMHMKGTPETMQQHTEYQYIIGDLIKYFVNRLRLLNQKGIRDVVIDPGFGFAKTLEQNFQLIQQLGLFTFLDRPVMVGVSRKSSLSKTIGRPAEDTLDATTALHMVALQNGASILRVHDVRPAMDAILVYNQVMSVDTLNNKRLNQE